MQNRFFSTSASEKGITDEVFSACPTKRSLSYSSRTYSRLAWEHLNVLLRLSPVKGQKIGWMDEWIPCNNLPWIPISYILWCVFITSHWFTDAQSMLYHFTHSNFL